MVMMADDSEQDGKILALVKDGYRCVNHKEIEEKLSDIRDELFELKLSITGLKDTKADKEELWKLREKLMDLQVGVSEIKNALTEIKNNSEEDRAKIKELINELVANNLELAETNKKMTILERDYDLILQTHEKMNLFFETSISFQIGKMIKQGSKVLDTLKKSNGVMKFTINSIGWIILISIVWGLISMFMYLTNQTLPIEKVIELVRLLLGK